MPLVRALVTCLLLALGSAAAHAHASLVASDPGDGAILDEAPSHLVLTFNEPVSPLVLRLVAGDGTITPLDRHRLTGKELFIELPAEIGPGAYALSWRVVSGDGHPVGGSVVFSIGAPASGVPALETPVDWSVRLAIVIVRIIVYAGLLIGVGGLFFHAFIGLLPPAARCVQHLAILPALVGVPVSVGLQGLDALDAPVSDLVLPEVWRAALATSYGSAAIIAVFALVAALVGSRLSRSASVRAVAVAALVALGLAFASTGHAGTASPEWLTRPAVFVHTVAVAIWAGSLPPLGLLLRRPDAAAAAALARFSRAIPCVVVPLIFAGVALALVQMRSPEEIWTTAYGRVLLAKLVLVAALLGLATVNRWCFTAPAMAGDGKATRRLVRSVAFEVGLIVAILVVVALWRFTPPPRSIEVMATRPAVAHLQAGEMTGELVLTPGHAGPVTALIRIGPAEEPLDAKEVTLIISNPGAGIEPIRRTAAEADDGRWRVDGLTLPVPGRWTVRIAVLVSDFDLVGLEGAIDVGP